MFTVLMKPHPLHNLASHFSNSFKKGQERVNWRILGPYWNFMSFVDPSLDKPLFCLQSSLAAFIMTPESLSTPLFKEVHHSDGN